MISRASSIALRRSSCRLLGFLFFPAIRFLQQFADRIDVRSHVVDPQQVRLYLLASNERLGLQVTAWCREPLDSRKMSLQALGPAAVTSAGASAANFFSKFSRNIRASSPAFRS